MDVLWCLLIVSTCITSVVALTYPGFEDLSGARVFKTCEGFDDNLDVSGITVYRHANKYAVDGNITLRKTYHSPIKVLVQLIRPNESPVQAFKTVDFCNNMGNREKEEYELDLFQNVLFKLIARNNYHCPLEKGSYYLSYHIKDWLVAKLAKLIDQEGTMRMEFSDDACIEYTFKRTGGTRENPTRGAGSAPSANPAQEEKKGGLQKIFKFLKGLFSK